MKILKFRCSLKVTKPVLKSGFMHESVSLILNPLLSTTRGYAEWNLWYSADMILELPKEPKSKQLCVSNPIIPPTGMEIPTSCLGTVFGIVRLRDPTSSLLLSGSSAPEQRKQLKIMYQLWIIVSPFSTGKWFLIVFVKWNQPLVQAVSSRNYSSASSHPELS